jgi:hypothetical protein
MLSQQPGAKVRRNRAAGAGTVLRDVANRRRTTCLLASRYLTLISTAPVLPRGDGAFTAAWGARSNQSGRAALPFRIRGIEIVGHRQRMTGGQPVPAGGRDFQQNLGALPRCEMPRHRSTPARGGTEGSNPASSSGLLIIPESGHLSPLEQPTHVTQPPSRPPIQRTNVIAAKASRMTSPVSAARTAIRRRATAKAVSTRVPKRAQSIASWVPELALLSRLRCRRPRARLSSPVLILFTANELRFFADRAAKKWPLRGSLKLR